MNLTLEYDSFQDFANKLWPCLSEEGMWVSSDNLAGVGELVDFDVMLADGFRLFHGSGQVIAVGPGPKGGPGGEGMTLQFSQLDQPSRNLVRKVVSKHIGEGGKLFVLAAPGTKVEVVGDDEGGTADSSVSEGGMGPEDLVAPFAGLEEDEGWTDDQEPGLSSFLRPSGRGADRDEEAAESTTSEPAMFDPPSPETSGLEPQPSEPGLFEAPTPDAGTFEPAAQVGQDSGLGSDLGSDLGSGLDSGLESGLDLEQDGEEEGAGSVETPAAVPVVERWETVAEEASGVEEAFEATLAETQRVEPMQSPDPEVESPLSGEAETFPPMPSTVIPPPFPEHGSEGESDAPTDEVYPQGMAASAGRTWWPWVVIVGLAVGAGLYALLQMDTPLSGLFGNEAGAEQTTSDPASRSDSRADGAQEASGAPTAEGEIMDVIASGVDESGADDEGVASEQPAGAEAEASADAPAAAVESAGEPPAPGVDAAVASVAPSAAEPALEPSTPDSAVAATDSSSEGSAGARPPAVPAPAASAMEPLGLQRITWRAEEGDTVVRLALSGPIEDDRLATQRVVGGTPRVVLRINGAQGGVPRGPVAIGSEHVRQLRFGIHNVDGVRQVHAVADLADENVELVSGPVIADGGVELRFGRP